MKRTPKHRPRSGALQAFRAKDEEARQRLSRIFLAFVKVSREQTKRCRGFFVIGVNRHEETDSFNHPNFAVRYIGYPSLQVKEVDSLVTSLASHWESRVSQKDFYATVARNAVASFNQAVLEAQSQPRAQAVECMFVDCLDRVQWVDYSGDYGERRLNQGPREVLVRGAYDKEMRSQVTSILSGLLRGRITAARVNATIKKLRSVTKVRIVRFIQIA